MKHDRTSTSRKLSTALVLSAVLALTTGCSDGPTAPQEGVQPQLSLAETGVAGLIHLWSGEGDVNDAVGGANGTLGATATFGPGLNGQAFSFNGAQSSINRLPVNIGPSALPQMTMGMWVNLRSAPNARGWVMGHDNGGYDRSINLTDNRYGYGVAGGTGRSPHASSLIKLREHLNTWHCVAVSYDRVAQTATFYADGQTQTVPATPGEGLTTATLGGLAAFGGHQVNGLVDEVFMFNRVLTPAELDQVCAWAADVTAPTVVATLAPAPGKSLKHNKGLFTVAASCTDAVDGVIPPTSVLLNGIAVVNGQVVDLRLKSEKSDKSNKSDKSKKSGKSEKPVKIESASFALVVECVDESGNGGTATAVPEFAEKSKKSGKSKKSKKSRKS